MAKKRKRTKKPNCTNSFSCGFGCISRSRTCRSNIDDKGNKIVENYAESLIRTIGLKDNKTNKEIERLSNWLEKEDAPLGEEISNIVENTIKKARKEEGSFISDKLEELWRIDDILESPLNNIVSVPGSSELNRPSPERLEIAFNEKERRKREAREGEQQRHRDGQITRVLDEDFFFLGLKAQSLNEPELAKQAEELAKEVENFSFEDDDRLLFNTVDPDNWKQEFEEMGFDDRNIVSSTLDFLEKRKN